MFYTKDFLDEHLEIYASEKEVREDEMDPDDFVRWVFPKLLDYRKINMKRLPQNMAIESMPLMLPISAMRVNSFNSLKTRLTLNS